MLSALSVEELQRRLCHGQRRAHEFSRLEASRSGDGAAFVYDLHFEEMTKTGTLARRKLEGGCVFEWGASGGSVCC